MALTVELDAGRAACAESIESFLRAVDSLGEYELLDGSRCHGWSRLDVVVHVLAGWQEMLGGLVSPVDAEPSVDAASYWQAFAAQFATDDPVPEVMSQRRRTAAFARPSDATAQLRDVGAVTLRGVAAVQDSPLLWQGHVFTPGDYLAVWAVEHAVHHLDLISREPPPRSALGLARATIEAIAGEPLPAAWTDEEATLIGAGRAPVPHGLGGLRLRLPALG